MAMFNFIPDNFQGVAETISDRLSKASRVDFVTDVSKENSFKTHLSYLGANNAEHRNTFNLRPGILSIR